MLQPQGKCAVNGKVQVNTAHFHSFSSVILIPQGPIQHPTGQRVWTGMVPGEGGGPHASLKKNFFFNLLKKCLTCTHCWIYLLTAVLALCRCTWAFSTCSVQGFSLRGLLLLRSMGSRHRGLIVGAHRLSCSKACGIFPDQGSNPWPLCWQVDSYPLHHQCVRCCFSHV